MKQQESPAVCVFALKFTPACQTYLSVPRKGFIPRGDHV